MSTQYGVDLRSTDLHSDCYMYIHTCTGTIFLYYNFILVQMWYGIPADRCQNCALLWLKVHFPRLAQLYPRPQEQRQACRTSGICTHVAYILFRIIQKIPFFQLFLAQYNIHCYKLGRWTPGTWDQISARSSTCYIMWPALAIQLDELDIIPVAACMLMPVQNCAWNRKDELV